MTDVAGLVERLNACMRTIDPSTSFVTSERRTIRESATALAQQAEKIKEAQRAFNQIIEQYANQDLSHVDFRVKATECALSALAKLEE